MLSMLPQPEPVSQKNNASSQVACEYIAPGTEKRHTAMQDTVIRVKHHEAQDQTLFQTWRRRRRPARVCASSRR
jgi:hypothetical protein